MNRVRNRPRPRPGAAEFVALAASMMAMLAVSIDIVLPALPQIADELGAERANDRQYVVSAVVLGMSIGQLFYGPLSDGIGRKPAVALGLGVFALGCVTCLVATQFWAMIVGRFLNGLGAAGPRIVTVALVRDQYTGAAMARILSVVVSALMIGPLLAPFLGQGLLLVADWRIVFAVLLGFDLGVLAWLAVRQPETLPRERRMSLDWGSIASSVKQVCTSRVALGCSLAAGIAFGELFAYVFSAQQIFQEVYRVGAWFPLCFAVSGVSIAAASLVNARLVMKLGMRKLCMRAAACKVLLASLLLVSAWAGSGSPPLWLTLSLIAALFFCVGLLFANLNARALEPLGQVAGMAAGFVGSLTWSVAMLLATWIAQRFDESVVPLAAGFVLLSAALVGVLRWIDAGGT